MQLCVTVYLPGHEGEKFVFEHGDISIGRADENDLVLGERGVSGRHARLLVTGSEVTLIDLESTNGTYVNGERIFGPAVLAPDDDIALCEYRLLVRFDGAGAGASAPSRQPLMTSPPPMLESPQAGQRVSLAHDAATPTGQMDRSIPPPPIEAHATRAPAMLDLSIDHPASSFIDTAEDDSPAAVSPVPSSLTPVPSDSRPVRRSVPPAPLAPPSSASVEVSVAPPMMHASTPSPVAAPPTAGHTMPPAPIDPPRAQAQPAAPAVAASPVTTDSPSASAPPPLLEPPTTVPAPVSAAARPAEAPTPAPAPAPVRPRESTSPHVADRPASASGSFTVDEPAAVRPTRQSGANMSAAEFGGFVPAATMGRYVGIDDVFARLVREPQHGGDAAFVRAALDSVGVRDQLDRRVAQVQAELAGCDPLSQVLDDPEMTEVWLQAGDPLVIRRGGACESISDPFSCAAGLHHVIERLAGRRFCADEPFIDMFTDRGVHLRAVHASWTQAGTAVVVTRAATSAPTLDDLVGAGEVSREIADLLELCVQHGLRLLVCGGPDVSTAPLLHALASAVPDHVRQVVVCCGQAMPDTSRHALVLRAPEQAALSRLIDTALQFDPGRLLVHGAGGAEAADGLLALARLPAGGVVSLQAATATDGLRRLATMFRLAEGCSQEIAASYIAGAVDLVLGVGKIADGRQLVLEVAEPTLATADAPPGGATPVAIYDAGSGSWVATGSTPRFFSDLRRRGVHPG